MKSVNKKWTIIRILLFITIGLFNTVFIKPEDIDTWKNYLGYGLLAIGIIDAVILLKNYIRQKNQ